MCIKCETLASKYLLDLISNLQTNISFVSARDAHIRPDTCADVQISI